MLHAQVLNKIRSLVTTLGKLSKNFTNSRILSADIRSSDTQI